MRTMCCKLRNSERGSATVIFVMIIAVILALQFMVLCEYTVARAQYQDRIRQAYDLVVVMEEISMYLEQGNADYNKYHNPPAPAAPQPCPGTEEPPLTLTSAGTGTGFKFCLPDAPGYPGKKGIVHTFNGQQVFYPILTAPNSVSLVQNKHVTGANSEVAAINVKDNTPPSQWNFSLDRFFPSLGHRMAQIASFEVKMLSHQRLSDPLMDEAQASPSAAPSPSPGTTSSTDEALANRTLYSFTPVAGPAAPAAYAVACGAGEGVTAPCGQIQICPSWDNGACTPAQLMTMTFKFAQAQ